MSRTLSSRPSEAFWAGGGMVAVFLQLPLVKMILDDPQSLSLGAWNLKTYGLFCAITFIAFPLAAGLLFLAFFRVRPALCSLVLAGLAGLLITMTVNVHVLQLHFLEAPWRRPATWGILAVTFLLLWRFRRLFLRIFATCGGFGLIVFAVFTAQAAPFSARPFSPPAISSTTAPTNQGPVFILTFEKLISKYLVDSKGAVLADRFPNLARFTSEADYYPNAYANSAATIYGLKCIYSGRFWSSERDWTRYPTVRDLLGRNGRVYMFLDILTEYAVPGRHIGVRSIGEENVRGMDLISGWYRTYMVSILPDPLEDAFPQWGLSIGFNPRINLWQRERSQLLPGEQLTVKIGQRQFHLLEQTVRREGRAPNLYIMHNFVSDGPPVKSLELRGSTRLTPEDLEAIRTNLSEFDRSIGEFIDFLKTAGLYDSALILITTDTGFDPMLKYVEGEKKVPAADEAAHIYLAFKRPNQTQGRIFTPVIRHIDILPTLMAGLGMDPQPYGFQGRPVTNPDDSTGLAQHPLDFIITSDMGGILFYRLTNPAGPFIRTPRSGEKIR